jgi:glutamate 5-kinase
VGQGLLVARYTASFARYGIRVGQVLLTSDDMSRRSHHRNASRTLDKLLAMGALPIVNENDTVATDEIRFGDNDRLAALVAHLIGADALVLLSDVDALYTGDPRRAGARRITEVADESDLADVTAGTTGASGVGTGGMASKLAAARLASSAGIPVLLASAADAASALASSTVASSAPAAVGTAFAATGSRLSARRFWLAHAADSTGRLTLDDGAVAAVVTRRRSLLAAGIAGVDGDFDAGDVVDLTDLAGRVVARGVVAFDAVELPAMIGRSSQHLAPEQRREVVHADDLVPLPPRS